MNDTKTTEVRGKTSYVVLARMTRADGATSQTWSVAVEVEAANAQDAVRQAAKDAEGVYVAVPARSWQPVTVKVETRTVVKLT